jgi:SET family sugar efflux transporter-like MFS transporter
MGVLVRKQKGAFLLTGIAKLAVIFLLVNLGGSLIGSIWAVYIDSFVNNISYVGFISAFLTLVCFVSYFFFIPLIEKKSKSKIFFYSLFLFAINYILLAINKNFIIFIILAISASILGTLRITSFGIIVRDKSNERHLSRNEGLMYTLMNIAWLIGPLIAGYIANEYDVSNVFVLASIIFVLSAILFNISRIRDNNIKKHVDDGFFKNFKSFFRNKNRRLAYILGGGVNFWTVLLYIFMPLYIIREGLSDLWIGYFLFAVAFPLILTEYKFAKTAGKIGFKKSFVIGFLILSFSAFLCFFVSNPYVVMSILTLASFGLAFVEPTTEAYFFDIIKKKDECRYYGPYNTSIDVNQFVAEALSGLVLLFFPFKFIFLFFGIVMFSLSLLSLKIKNLVEDK